MLASPIGVDRVVMVVLDGLRADTPVGLDLPHLTGLAAGGAWTYEGQTVLPSVTAAAMTSVFTGVAPAVHGIRNDRFSLPRPNIPPLTAILREHGLETHGYLARVPLMARFLAGRLAQRLGAMTTFRGTGAMEILDAARPVLAERGPGLVVLHWPDVDIAGHGSGWHSAEYGAAARRLDAALGALIDVAGIPADPRTLLVAFADHGGGGVVLDDHDSDHPDDTTIPVILAGRGVAVGPIRGPVSLLDIPATVLWALGIATPWHFGGRPLAQAFETSARSDVIEAA